MGLPFLIIKKPLLRLFKDFGCSLNDFIFLGCDWHWKELVDGYEIILQWNIKYDFSGMVGEREVYF